MQQWMGAPDSAIKDGLRWGIAKHEPICVLDDANKRYRVQIIGEKTVWHLVKVKK